MKEIAIFLVAILATCVAEKMLPCMNMSNEHGKTMVTMMISSDIMKIFCSNNRTHMCKWWHRNAAMPDCYGNIEIGSKGTMKITKATVHNSGSYTLDMGTTTETHHIIVKPAEYMPIVIEVHHILNILSYIFHSTCMKIMILVLIYHMRPEQPMREEERDEDEGDLPFPIREVGPN